MKKLCGVCKKSMGKVKPLSDKRVFYGVCKPCKRKVKKETAAISKRYYWGKHDIQTDRPLVLRQLELYQQFNGR